jgi:hypothetical protein
MCLLEQFFCLGTRRSYLYSDKDKERVSCSKIQLKVPAYFSINILNLIIMAKLVMGILGGFRGKVGTVVGSIWNGIDTIRAYVANVANPNSPAQLDHRAKFKLIGGFLKPLTSFLRIGFKSLAIKMTASNAAMKYNMENAITGVYPDYTVDYTKALVSSGQLPGALNPVATSTVAGEVEYTWEDNSWDAGADDGDKAMLVVYNPERKLSVSFVGGNTRGSGSQILTLPAIFSGDEVKCYISFANAAGSVVSDSQFVSSLIVL